MIYEKFPGEFAARDKIIEQINNHELGDPSGPDGERVMQFMFDLARKTRELFSDLVKFNTGVMQSLRSGKLSQLELTPEGIKWISQATLSYWVKRWDVLYDTIVDNLKLDPLGKTGKKITNQWTALIDEFLSVGPRSLIIGIMIWQDLARQHHDLQASEKTPSVQEMMKEYHIKLAYNPEVANWITQALEMHTLITWFVEACRDICPAAHARAYCKATSAN